MRRILSILGVGCRLDEANASLKVNECLHGESTGTILHADVRLKTILERLGVEHTPISDSHVMITGDQALALIVCLNLLNKHEQLPEGWGNTIELVSKLSGLMIRRKSSAFIGVRVGRPEKAMPRHMRPPSPRPVSRWQICRYV